MGETVYGKPHSDLQYQASLLKYLVSYFQKFRMTAVSTTRSWLSYGHIPAITQLWAPSQMVPSVIPLQTLRSHSHTVINFLRAVTLLYYIIAITSCGHTTTLLWLHHSHAPPVFVSRSHHAPITFRGLCITQVTSHNQCLLKLVGQDHSIQFCATWRPI